MPSDLRHPVVLFHRRRASRGGEGPGHRPDRLHPDVSHRRRLPGVQPSEPDFGTTFTEATRAFGPVTGWMGGWGIIVAAVIVMANLAQIAGSYSFTLLGRFGMPGRSDLSNSILWATVAGLLWITLMTWICYREIEISALIRVYFGTAESYSLVPTLDWFNPFTLDFTKVIAPAMLTAIFIYWGWDTAVSVNEETADPAKTPGPCRRLRRCRHERSRSRESQQRERRLLRNRTAAVWKQCHRTHPAPAADRVHPHLGIRIDVDDDPADGAPCAFHGGQQGNPGRVRAHPPEVPHAHLVDDQQGDRLGGVLSGVPPFGADTLLQALVGSIRLVVFIYGLGSSLFRTGSRTTRVTT